MTRTGKFSPDGDRFYASNPFWKTKWELNPSFSQGISERNGCCLNEGSDTKMPVWVPPDLPPFVQTTPGVTIKGRSTPRRARSDTPGPGSYNTSKGIGDSVGKGATIQARSIDSRLFVESTQRPGPGSYSIREECGKYRPAFSVAGRIQDTNTQTPVGPGDYNIKTIFDKYNITPVNWTPPFTKRLHDS
jgi:hypothetical protein